jgi:hypothetical protein
MHFTDILSKSCLIVGYILKIDFAVGYITSFEPIFNTSVSADPGIEPRGSIPGLRSVGCIVPPTHGQSELLTTRLHLIPN